MRQWELAFSPWWQEQTPHSPLLTIPGFHHFSPLVSICVSSASCEPQRHRSVQDLSVISSEHRESNHVRKLGQLIRTSTERRASLLLPAASLWLSQEVEKWLRAAMIFVCLVQGSRSSSRSSSPSVRMLPPDKTGSRGYFSPEDPTGNLGSPDSFPLCDAENKGHWSSQQSSPEANWEHLDSEESFASAAAAAAGNHQIFRLTHQ